MEITEKDREEFPSMDDHTIIAHKIMRAQNDEKLLNILRESYNRDEMAHEITKLTGGTYTNPSWVTLRAANILLDRNLISESEHDYYTR